MKIGVICDGISRDLSRAVAVMDEFDLKHAELQYVWDKEVGDHSHDEILHMKQLLSERGKSVTCLSRHIFAGLTYQDRPGGERHRKHMDALRRVIEMAHIVDSPLVRILSPRKEQILWGRYGAEKWNAVSGAWEAILPLVEPAVELARKEGKMLVVETGNGTMVNSAYTARKLIDDLDALDVLKVLWDPANSLWCHESAFPEGYSELRGGYLGHIHMKDVHVDTPRATLESRPFGKGQLADQFQPIADALTADGYEGVISFESVFHPGDSNYEAGFRRSILPFKAVFAPE